MVWRSDMDRVDIRTRQQLAKVVVGGAVVVLVTFVHLAFGVIAGAGSHVAGCHVLDISMAQEGGHVTFSHVADADTAHDNPVTGRWSIGIAQSG